ncbi:hypothetical protein OG455_27710 [Kitasatospora sp. NBC_01287]|uniref:hypothetical protein n=1 Tax=Kitasatospora sp. NBC_01287 TaxID=2903573 RepID=UPI00225564F0|nr:hypothetical protein [Kitasatospora sp. NBC_01287]MCX4749248.1 hypothetical protein [Kitasatospora sp. NBC_01287]
MTAVLQDQLPGLEAVRRIVQPPADSGRQQTIQERFEQFHAHNPWVLSELERLVGECIDAKFSKISLGMLFEIIRYSYGRATLSADDFRLNNDFRSRYARLLTHEHPHWAPYIEVRALRTD